MQVQLQGLAIDPAKDLARVQTGTLALADYLAALAQHQGVSAGWTPGGEYEIDFGRGLKDPSGADLTVPEIAQLVRALIPSALQSAGKRIRLRGPMLGFVSGLVKAECYAADVVVEVLDRAQGGLLTTVQLAPLERARVRLRNPDSAESSTALGGQWLNISTSQLSYRRRVGRALFNYRGSLDLVFIDAQARPGQLRAQVCDGLYYAWVNDVAHLEDA
ncbi:MAG TPA: hypothetical protein VFS21_03350 [Roseiflexaceae bacterium]|nr:hypothetical protein [Roseiflexaceae bacterium]